MTEINNLIFIIVAYAILGSPLEINRPSYVTSLYLPNMLVRGTRTFDNMRKPFYFA